jgi:lipid II:glycine glycyltransferase (peptidoglycan interpeptide bridge formation enzyme)
MADVRQSPEYAKFIESLGWQVEKLGKDQVFIKKIPLLGSLIKIQRAHSLDFNKIDDLARKHHAFQIIIEPATIPPNISYPSNYRPLKSPCIPTKTLVLDLNKSEQAIFESFSKNKRRDILLSERKGVVIKEGEIEDFVNLKKQYLWQKFIFPIGVKRDLVLLKQAFGSKAKVLLAYLDNKPVAGTLLLFSGKTAYYWQAAATSRGKKTLAPTALVWESVKRAKKQGFLLFDFEGIADPRYPEQNSWKGFTHFKQGFRGTEITYPQPFFTLAVLPKLRQLLDQAKK